MAIREDDRAVENARALERKLDAIGWGLFFIWIGVSFMTNFSWGVGLLGIGAITVFLQLVRKYFGLLINRFWLTTGIVFAVWGLVELTDLSIGETPLADNLLPIVFIVAGIAFIVSALTGGPRQRVGH